MTAFNSEYLAVAAEVDLVIEFRGPDPENPTVQKVLWDRAFKRNDEPRAYRIVFSPDDEFVTMAPVSWAEARAALGEHIPTEAQLAVRRARAREPEPAGPTVWAIWQRMTTPVLWRRLEPTLSAS